MHAKFVQDISKENKTKENIFRLYAWYNYSVDNTKVWTSFPRELVVDDRGSRLSGRHFPSLKCHNLVQLINDHQRLVEFVGLKGSIQTEAVTWKPPLFAHFALQSLDFTQTSPLKNIILDYSLEIFSYVSNTLLYKSVDLVCLVTPCLVTWPTSATTIDISF